MGNIPLIKTEENNIWYLSHNIIPEKCELYYDFLYSLLSLINQTHLGNDVIVTDIDKHNHFDWCLDNIIDNFNKEKIYFNFKSIDLDHLWSFFKNTYYLSEHENKFNIINDYFKTLFDYNHIKTLIELENFTQFYNLFDKNLKKTN